MYRCLYAYVIRFGCFQAIYIIDVVLCKIVCIAFLNRRKEINITLGKLMTTQCDATITREKNVMLYLFEWNISKLDKKSML